MNHSIGLKFRKLDLHSHTPASTCFGDKSVSPDAIVKTALAKGLDGIAITDHNSGAFVDEVIAAAKGTPLTVFPGVEITCMGGKEGIHIIALFDPTCRRADIESLLGDLELKPSDYGNISSIVQKDPIEVVRTIDRRGGLAVLAHANSTRGALNDMRGIQRITLIQNPAVKAAEATDFRNEKLEKEGKRTCDFLNGSDPDYKRKLAVYQASDNPASEGSGEHSLVGIGTRCAYFKLDRVNLDGLRQCFADPDVRIRQDYEYTTARYPRIVSVKVTGGFLDGSEAEFHEGLNSILGGKGAGKSLLIEFLRFALDQSPTNEDILRDHESKLQERLEDYGRIQVTVQDETGKDVVIERTLSHADGHPYASSPHPDLASAFPVLFLSQNEIIKIAESEDEQIRFIDRFFDFRAYQTEIEHLETRLSELDKNYGAALRAFQESKQLEKLIKAAESEIVKLDEALKNPLFDKYASLEAKDRAARTQIGYVATLVTRFEQIRSEVAALTVPGLSAELKNDPVLLRLSRNCAKGQTSATDSVDALLEALKKLDVEAREEYAKWEPAFREGKSEYQRQVQEMGGDYKLLAQKRERKVSESQQLERRLVKVIDTSSQLEQVAERRREVVDQLRDARERYTRERQDHCARIEGESGGRLKITIKEASNTDEFSRRLTALKRGSYLRDAEIALICTRIDPTDFIRAIIQYSVSRNPKYLGNLVGKTNEEGLTFDRMQTLIEFLLTEYRLEDLLTLEYQAIPRDRPEILYNVGSDKYARIDKLSVGQKATAMLVIALTEGTMPIIVDQPEDSLDIRSIWDDICSKIRDGKAKRQFVFTTHNSSVAVASDTDKFIIMEGDAEKGRVVFSGSMDHAPVSTEVLKYLEGGPRTYRAKFEKYRGQDLIK